MNNANELRRRAIVEQLREMQARRVELESELTELCPICVDCERGAHAPSHNGFYMCRSGSIASGGNQAHCTCDTCF